MQTKITRILVLLITIVLFSLPINAYKQDNENSPVHQYVTKQSVDTWVLAPREIRTYSNSSIYVDLADNYLMPVKYTPGKDLIFGSGEEDIPIYEAFKHFWEPDTVDNDEICRGVLNA